MNRNPESLPLLTMAALGVVFGDIGTSPLYTLGACLAATSLPADTGNLLGILSLLFWTLMLVVSVKYAGIVMRADNHGEGGVMALTALASRAARRSGRISRRILALGLLGAALFYGDGVITPAISVLSAVEGIGVASPAGKAWILPLALGILIGLFSVQSRGTTAVAHLFGPAMAIWFFLLFASGLRWVLADPRILLALNPWFGLRFLATHGPGGFLVLGGVVLAVTGAEALYADIGHFGSRPIRAAWFAVVLPALTMNYLGQGALLDRNPGAIRNPFFQLFPPWATLPMVAVSGVATVIASQAVISGAYSATHQALLLGYLPRMKVVHTSEAQRGQVYLPALNWLLLGAVVAVVLGFRSSAALSSAYGTAVTGTMLLTTLLIVFVARRSWKWPLWGAGLFFGCFLLLDGAFFGANLMKFREGGWFPLAIGLLVFVLMSTWHREREILTRRLYPETLRIEGFLDSLAPGSPIRVPGTAVYLTSGAHGLPHALQQNLAHNKVLHEQVILLTVLFEEAPRLPPSERVALQKYPKGFVRLIARYGFMEQPNIQELLDACVRQGLLPPLPDVTFFLSRQRVIPTEKMGIDFWRERLFASMLRLSTGGGDFFGLPPARVMELGNVVELSPGKPRPRKRRPA